jgi:hypothetical protein
VDGFHVVVAGEADQLAVAGADLVELVTQGGLPAALLARVLLDLRRLNGRLGEVVAAVEEEALGAPLPAAVTRR